MPSRTLPGVSRPAVVAEPADTIPTATLHQILKEMRRLEGRDALMELVLIAVRPFAPKTALFAVKRDAFVGLICTSDFGDRDRLAKVRIDASAPSVLATVAAAGEYVGRLVRSEAHAPLFEFIKSPKPEVLATAIRAADKPAVILLAHEIGDALKVAPVVSEIVGVASETLTRIVRRRAEKG